jgi:hypothetical protein
MPAFAAGLERSGKPVQQHALVIPIVASIAGVMIQLQKQ